MGIIMKNGISYSGTSTGIESIDFTSSSAGGVTPSQPGATDTYTVALTDGTTSTFTVYNGNDGAQGPAGATGARGATGATGAPGADGVTPHIGDNGNWFIGETDTGTPAGSTEKTYYVNTGRFVMTPANDAVAITTISKENFRGLTFTREGILACFTDRIECYKSMADFEAGNVEKTKSLANMEINDSSGNPITGGELEGIGSFETSAFPEFEASDIKGNMTCICIMFNGGLYVTPYPFTKDFFKKTPEFCTLDSPRDDETIHYYLGNGNGVYVLRERTLEEGIDINLFAYGLYGMGCGNGYTSFTQIQVSDYRDDYHLDNADKLQISQNMFIVKGTSAKIMAGYLGGYNERLMRESEYDYVAHACAFNNSLIYVPIQTGSDLYTPACISGTDFNAPLASYNNNKYDLKLYTPNNIFVTNSDIEAMISTENYMLIRYSGDLNKTIIYDKKLTPVMCDLEFNDFDNIVETSEGLYLIQNDMITKLAFEKKETDLQTALMMVNTHQAFNSTGKY